MPSFLGERPIRISHGSILVDLPAAVPTSTLASPRPVDRGGRSRGERVAAERSRRRDGPCKRRPSGSADAKVEESELGSTGHVFRRLPLRRRALFARGHAALDGELPLSGLQEVERWRLYTDDRRPG